MARALRKIRDQENKYFRETVALLFLCIAGVAHLIISFPASISRSYIIHKITLKFKNAQVIDGSPKPFLADLIFNAEEQEFIYRQGIGVRAMTGIVRCQTAAIRKKESSLPPRQRSPFEAFPMVMGWP